MTAADRWRDDLTSWAIPAEILAQAPTSPWIHPVSLFTVAGDVPDSLSHRRAREALPVGGSVLDVASGGGRASMALADRAGLIVGVDHQQAMLDAYAAAADARGLVHEEVLGDWPDVSAQAPACDVVVAHHVVYNVPDLAPFLIALHEHARHRVVIEAPTRHPLSGMSPLWERFWGLSRPTRPTAHDVVAVAADAGIAASIEEWDDDPAEIRASLPFDEQVRFNRIRLCLPEEREPEVAEAMRDMPPVQRRMATIWWDAPD